MKVTASNWIAGGAILVALAALFLQNKASVTNGDTTLGGANVAGNTFNVTGSGLVPQNTRTAGNYPTGGSCGCGGQQAGINLASNYLPDIPTIPYPDFAPPSKLINDPVVPRDMLVGNGSTFYPVM